MTSAEAYLLVWAVVATVFAILWRHEAQRLLFYSKYLHDQLIKGDQDASSDQAGQG